MKIDEAIHLFCSTSYPKSKCNSLPFCFYEVLMLLARNYFQSTQAPMEPTFLTFLTEISFSSKMIILFASKRILREKNCDIDSNYNSKFLRIYQRKDCTNKRSELSQGTTKIFLYLLCISKRIEITVKFG